MKLITLLKLLLLHQFTLVFRSLINELVFFFFYKTKETTESLKSCLFSHVHMSAFFYRAKIRSTRVPLRPSSIPNTRANNAHLPCAQSRILSFHFWIDFSFSHFNFFSFYFVELCIYIVRTQHFVPSVFYCETCTVCKDFISIWSSCLGYCFYYFPWFHTFTDSSVTSRHLLVFHKPRIRYEVNLYHY